MSLAADALQPIFVRGLFSLRGRVLVANLPDIITSARKAGFDLDFVNSEAVRIDFRDPIFVADAIGGDASRFAIAAFVSLSSLSELTRVNRFAWEMIKLYYAAFYAGHCILRLAGESCSNLDGHHIARLQQLAAITDPGQSFPLSGGLHHCVLHESQTGFSIRKAQIPNGGDHAAFWEIFSAFLAAHDEEVLLGHLPPSDATQVFLKLSALRSILNGHGSTAGNWLSRVRNELQYRHTFSAWPPSSIKQAKRDLLLRLAVQWKGDPMGIELEYPPGKEFGEFVSACSFLVALCRALWERLATLSYEGAHSFAKGPLQYCA
jgi:hypothetical protein